MALEQSGEVENFERAVAMFVAMCCQSGSSDLPGVLAPI